MGAHSKIQFLPLTSDDRLNKDFTPIVKTRRSFSNRVLMTMTRHFSQRFLRKMIIASAAAVVADAPSVAVAAYGAVAVAAPAVVIESASGARYQNLKMSARI